jgi:hypothetical protein
MTAPLELIVAMMPQAMQITGLNREEQLSMKAIDSACVNVVQVAARMAEEAIRLSTEPEQDENRFEVREEVRNLLKSRLGDSGNREGLLKGLSTMVDGGMVGITRDGLACLRHPDPENGAITIVPASVVLDLIDEAESPDSGK